MAPPLKTKRRPMDEHNQDGFDVTCVVGRVSFDRHSASTPQQAAFDLIALHDANGTFVFPGPNGGDYRVTVEVPERDDFPA